MAILNFNFTKIMVEKTGKVTKQVNVASNMKLNDVKASEMVSGTKQKAFAINFSFVTKYEPKVGNINLDGTLLYLADEKLAKEIEDSWSKTNNLPKNVGLQVFNKILHHCNVEALILSKEINLPAPIQLPKVQAVSEKAASAKK